MGRLGVPARESVRKARVFDFRLRRPDAKAIRELDGNGLQRHWLLGHHRYHRANPVLIWMSVISCAYVVGSKIAQGLTHSDIYHREASLDLSPTEMMVLPKKV